MPTSGFWAIALRCAAPFLLLTSCADSETRTVVSKPDLPAGGYHRIIVVGEGAEIPAHTSPFSITHQSTELGSAVTMHLRFGSAPLPASLNLEQKVVSEIQQDGSSAVGATAFFDGRSLSDEEKARIVQQDFDAVLYVAVENGVTEEKVAASYDGQMVTFSTGVVSSVDELGDRYSLKPDGSVYYLQPTLKAKCDLQDTKTAKQVWSAETLTKGGSAVLVSSTAKQIAEKMHADGLI